MVLLILGFYYFKHGLFFHVGKHLFYPSKSNRQYSFSYVFKLKNKQNIDFSFLSSKSIHY